MYVAFYRYRKIYKRYEEVMFTLLDICRG